MMKGWATMKKTEAGLLVILYHLLETLAESWETMPRVWLQRQLSD